MGEHLHDGLPCGCTVRLVHFPHRATCPDCRRTWRPPATYCEWPTATEVGQRCDLQADCPRCGADLVWSGIVLR
jgi:Zn finger protein HypA/HybF involved in hydrogenase expression